MLNKKTAYILALLMAVQVVIGFRFVSWGDTKSHTSDLDALSKQVVKLSPTFTLYQGDLEQSGFTTSGIAAWKQALNGGGNMFDKTFSIRGNHDKSNLPAWQTYFNFKGVANNVGATNYKFMGGSDDIVYSFDYGNSHFVALDDTVSTGQSTWLDQDLAAAEARGLQHTFIYFHGPIYRMDGHCDCPECNSRVGCVKRMNVVDVIKKHPIVTATFHGHEHVNAHVFLDNTRIPELQDYCFHQFITGAAGAGPKPCDKTVRFDYCMSAPGFVTVDVNNLNVKVDFYKMGSNSVQKTVSFTKGQDCNVNPPQPPQPPVQCIVPCPQCNNGIQDCDETGRDCGGSCQSCTQIKCSLDSDCGQETLIGKSCSGNNVVNSYQGYRCYFPGTPQSMCIGGSFIEVTDNCILGCSNGVCV